MRTYLPKRHPLLSQFGEMTTPFRFPGLLAAREMESSYSNCEKNTVLDEHPRLQVKTPKKSTVFVLSLYI